MSKYFVLFRIPVASMDEWMKSVSPEERKKQSDGIMDAWKPWREKHAGAIIEDGQPLGRTKTLTSAGITDSRNDLNYYMIVQANSHEEAADIFADNPHLQIPTSSIDVMEIPHMGM